MGRERETLQKGRARGGKGPGHEVVMVASPSLRRREEFLETTVASLSLC